MHPQSETGCLSFRFLTPAYFILDLIINFLLDRPRRTNSLGRPNRRSVASIADIVIPDVFKTVEARNKKLYVTCSVLNIKYKTIIDIDDGYYNGFSFAEEITNQ